MPYPPEVSVVIPTRFRPELVLRAVRGALAQTVRNIEVIVVIDGPDAGTAAALDAVGDPRVRAVPLPASGGAPNARNVGARHARARWTALLDDDDEWLPDKLAVQLRMATECAAGMPIVASRLINRTPRAEFVIPRRLPDPGEPLSEYFTVRRGLFHGDGFIQTSTILAPTELLRAVPFTVGLRRQQELDWALRAVRHPGAQLLIAPDPLVVWHQDEDRPRISHETPWQEQLAWLRASRELFTPRAYAAFLMSVVSSMAAHTRSRAVFAELLAEARRHGRPAMIDYLTFLQIWLLPPHLRHTVRDLVLGRRLRRARPAVPADGAGPSAPQPPSDGGGPAPAARDADVPAQQPAQQPARLPGARS
ncbi:glycosyltransferase family 2 protein [Plantactinospora sp. KBS50]|uniref:glycosyltransferase family 2 protein n=1 Tax=Plantactinospora sp. KBS50 TaxID=2024580 RepID=UPI000BAB03D4|nr:glycosyltransferase family 2 protein [Plantactinospora sp. KBS50]ASW55308.1 glycosyl transferase [Plantactinospora sp. KBS50]